MRLWIVKTLEPLPQPGGPTRLMRAGLIARLAAARGHQVTWWNSRFDRLTGSVRTPGELAAARDLGIEVELLCGPAYRQAISPRRFLHDLATALDFAYRAPRHRPPDAILVCMPPIELTAVVVAYARRREIPVAVDVRDIWPDVWLDAAPPVLRPLVRLAHPPYRRLLRWALRRADALFACGPGALRWTLELAARPAREMDGMFPHAVEVRELPADVRREAETFWDQAGLTRVRRPEERLRLVFAGSFTARTDCVGFIRNFRALPAAVRQGVSVWIAGGGPLEEEIRQAVAGDAAIRLLGWLDLPRLRILYERCDVGVLPHRRTFETGWTLVNKFGDYLAHGLPVLTTLEDDVGAFVRRHGCGLVWDPAHPRQLGDHLLRLKDPAFRERLRRQAAVVGEGFRAERVYGEMIARLEGLAHRMECGGPGPRGEDQPSMPTQGASCPTSAEVRVTAPEAG